MNEIRTLTVKAAPEKGRVIRFIASDESLDRDGDIVTAAGWKLDNYLKNPVVLYGHDYGELPVGKAEKVFIDVAACQLVIDVKFPAIKDISPDGEPSEHALFVDSVYNLAKLGLLNAVSVGFRGIKVEPILDGDGHYTGRRFVEQELMELSIVPVPANANAVAIMRSAKVDETVIKSFQATAKQGRRLSAASITSLRTIRGKLDECNRILDEARGEYATLVGDLDQGDEEDEGENEAPKQGTTPEAKNAEGIIEIIDTRVYEFDEPKNGQSHNKE